MPARASILIVEDYEVMAQLNARLLERRGYETSVAFTAAGARELFGGKEFDLYVLDITLPDGDGRTLCKEIRQRTDAPVLFLTGKTETRDKLESFLLGGDYYLTKPYDKDEFLAVVQALLRRAGQVQKKIDEASVITRGPIKLMVAERKAYVNELEAELTAKEFSLLLILVQNEDTEVSYETIYEQVWGGPMNDDVGALRQLVSRLRKKLDEENARGFSIFNKHGKGYTFAVLPTGE
ncbi:MAG: response regulator transcription factor [Oscillospiraceae bacterium]|nr:response regulator transcription factor [Oscillospiraceae bacterium]